jgi:hypothetical protein
MTDFPTRPYGVSDDGIFTVASVRDEIADAKPCPMCMGRWYSNGGTSHFPGCLFQAYLELERRLDHTQRQFDQRGATITSLQRELDRTQTDRDRYRRMIRRGF